MMVETFLIAISIAVAVWSALLVVVVVYLDDSVKAAELAGLLISLTTLLADKGRSQGPKQSGESGVDAPASAILQL